MPLIDGMLTLLVCGGVRFSVCLRLTPRARHGRSGFERVLVIGADTVGQMIVRELRSKLSSGLTPIGFLDSDDQKQRLRIVGLPVFGGYEALASVIEKQRIDQVVIA